MKSDKDLKRERNRVNSRRDHPGSGGDDVCGDPGRRPAEAKINAPAKTEFRQKNSPSEVVGEADDKQMEAPTSNPFRRTLHVSPDGHHAAIRRNVVLTRSVASLSIKGRVACPQAPHTRPRIPESVRHLFEPSPVLNPIPSRLSRGWKNFFGCRRRAALRPRPGETAGFPKPSNSACISGLKPNAAPSPEPPGGSRFFPHTLLIVLRHNPARHLRTITLSLSVPGSRSEARHEQ